MKELMTAEKSLMPRSHFLGKSLIKGREKIIAGINDSFYFMEVL